MSYIKTSTANPLGHRPFNSRIPTSPAGMARGFTMVPPTAPTFNTGVPPSTPAVNPTLKGYYAARFYEPDANSVLSRTGSMNVLSASALAGLGDYFPNYPRLVPTSINTRDNIYSPVPRIYLPPEMIPVPGIDPSLGSLGAVPARHSNRVTASHTSANPRVHAAMQRIAQRRRVSGGAFVADAAKPKGIFFPAEASAPKQFAIHAVPGIHAPSNDNPEGFYYPRRARHVPIPAELRVQRGKTWRDLGRLGSLSAGVARSGAFGGAPAPVRAPVRVSTPTPITSAPGGGIFTGPAPIRRPIVRGGGGYSPGGVYIPGTAPTYPAGAIPIGSGECQFTSSPESGGVVSVLPCDTLPGYSGGTPGVYTGWPGYPPPPSSSSPWVTNNPLLARGVALGPAAGGNANQNTAYQIALAAATNGTLTQSMLTGLTPAQQAAIVAASQTSSAAQQAALAAGGASSAVPAATDGTVAPVGDTQSLLDWLSESTLITGMPNWVIAAGGGIAALWLMNRGKK